MSWLQPSNTSPCVPVTRNRSFFRISELEDSISEIDAQLDLCFESGKDDLAKSLIRKKLETERLLKKIKSKHTADEKILVAQRATLAENRSALESLRQKAELVTQRTPLLPGSAGDGSIAWSPGNLSVDDDEVEVAYLREKSLRSTS